MLTDRSGLLFRTVEARCRWYEILGLVAFTELCWRKLRLGSKQFLTVLRFYWLRPRRSVLLGWRWLISKNLRFKWKALTVGWITSSSQHGHRLSSSSLSEDSRVMVDGWLPSTYEFIRVSLIIRHVSRIFWPVLQETRASKQPSLWHRSPISSMDTALLSSSLLPSSRIFDSGDTSNTSFNQCRWASKKLNLSLSE